jgi:thioester reductase-like protein
MNSLIDCLDHWTQTDPQRCLFTFRDLRGREVDHTTYDSFQKQTNLLAATLIAALGKQRGCRVLVSYPPGLEMIKAFVACVKLGAIPVPVPTISQSGGINDMARLNSIVNDSGATVVLTDQHQQKLFRDYLLKTSNHLNRSDLDALAALDWFATDLISGELDSFHSSNEDLLFLQYTSGSTRAPRGVMVTHQNVIHNCPAIHDYRPIGVSWLPHYHDMGLIGYYLFAFVTGGSSHYFSALDFMRRPALWLETITQVKATNTSAPNFAFDYCLRKDKLPDAALQSVDLSSLRNMMNASEPVRSDTVRSFLDRFETYGLSREALNVAYGLAEHTLRVSGGGTIHLSVNKERLARHQPFVLARRQALANAVSLPSVGRPLAGVDVRIVDPDSLVEKTDDLPGEIWIDSPSKAKGYWRQPTLSEDVFGARIGGCEANGEYLRTGDIGFFHEGELYVCGRIDDMVVIRGRNIFPPDIEATIESCFPEVEPGRVAVFGLPARQMGEAGLVVLIEARNMSRAPNVYDVHREIVSAYQIPVAAVAIGRRGSIARTTSGKIARHKCQSAFLQDQLDLLDIYKTTDTCEVGETIEEYLDALVRRSGRTVHESITIAELGLDSLELVELGLRLEKFASQGELSDNDYSSVIFDLRLLQAATVGELRTLFRQLRSGHVPLDRITRMLEDAMQAIEDTEAEQMRVDTELNASCIPKPNSSPPRKRTVLLTGATGFLGSFLLEALLRLSDDRIVALVRGQSEEHARSRLETALTKTGMTSSRVSKAIETRLQTVCGDIDQENLGLSEDQWSSFSDDITTIYHCAAEVDYLKTYQELRAANVTGTEEIIRLCCSGRTKELNFISTTFIFGWTVIGQKKETARNANMDGLNFGYPQSKWVAEQLVYEAEKRGLKTRVFRPALITASESGHYMRGDITTRVLGYMIRHQVSIDSVNQLSFLPVEICANNIVAIALQDDFRQTTFHLTAGKYYSMETACHLITKLFGYEFIYTDTDAFVDHVNNNCTPDDDLFPLIAFFNNSRDKFKAMSHMRYDNAFYRAYCERSALSKPEPDLEKTVTWLVSFLSSSGLIP